MKKQNSIIFSLIAVAIISTGVLATQNLETKETFRIGASLPDFPLEVLAENTPFAIKGTVIELIQIPIDENAFVKDVYTDVVIAVKEDLSGKYTEDTITVRIQGGETETAKYVYDGSPEFTLGEKVLILVADKEPESIFGDNYYVAGWQHGKYNLDQEGEAKNKDSDRDMSEKSLEDKIKKAKQKSPKGY